MKKSVLVIDDDKLMLNFLNGLLENEYDVMSADNGKDGMSLLLLHKPDLVILDLVMPYIDGYKFLNILNEKNIITPDKKLFFYPYTFFINLRILITYTVLINKCSSFQQIRIFDYLKVS